MKIVDWDDAYANRDHVPDFQDFVDRWPGEAAAFRDGLGPRAELDIRYGDHDRCLMDLFRPEAEAVGLVVFVHGGYWRSFDKTWWSQLAAGPVSRGWAVAMPQYALAPEVRIAEITAQVAEAVAEAAARVAGPIRLAGHSAGGHLVVRMICAGTRLKPEVVSRIQHVLSISGVHDLRPLLRTAMNADFRMDGAEASAESPALLVPVEGMRVTAWVGGAERPEFVRQATLLANVWTGLGADMAQVIEDGRHHFDVIESLGRADGALTECLLG